MKDADDMMTAPTPPVITISMHILQEFVTTNLNFVSRVLTKWIIRKGLRFFRALRNLPWHNKVVFWFTAIIGVICPLQIPF
ncbi:hypothetical protein BH10ACI3_BH10ACI3_13160 [soil metagenome]